LSDRTYRRLIDLRGTENEIRTDWVTSRDKVVPSHVDLYRRKSDGRPLATSLVVKAMIRHLLAMIRHTDSDAPRLLAQNGANGLEPEEDPDPDVDMTYEDALLTSEVRHFLQSEYGASEPPATSFRNLMRAIESESAPAAPARAARTAPVRSPSLLVQVQTAFPIRFARVSRAHLVSGAVALVVITSVLSANVSFLLRDDVSAVSVEQTPTAGETTRSTVSGVRTTAKAQESAQRYDADALLAKDPPETLAPPRRAAYYIYVEHESHDALAGPRKD